MRHGKNWLLAAGMAASMATGWAATATPAGASEPSRLAIMGVRLYMSAPDVLTSLYAQGVPEDAVIEHVHPCPLHASAACTDTITANLPDGPIVVRFTDSPAGFNEGREAAVSVTYTLQRATSAESLRSAAEERFGQLSDSKDSAWCARQTAQGCPTDQPRMSYQRTADGRATLSLVDLGLVGRLNPAGK